MGDARSVLGWISPGTYQHAAKTNSCGWFASCLRSLRPASREQPRDPQCSEGGAVQSFCPPTGFKTRDRRKHSDCRHMWSRDTQRGRKDREHERVRRLAQSRSWNWNIETKGKERRAEKQWETRPIFASTCKYKLIFWFLFWSDSCRRHRSLGCEVHVNRSRKNKKDLEPAAVHDPSALRSSCRDLLTCFRINFNKGRLQVEAN